MNIVCFMVESGAGFSKQKFLVEIFEKALYNSCILNSQRLHPAQIFFYCGVSFICGVFFGSLVNWAFLVFLVAVIACAAVYKLFLKKTLPAVLCLVIFLLGFGYANYALHLKKQQFQILDNLVGQEVVFTAKIIDRSVQGESQYLVLRSEKFGKVEIRVYTKLVPEYSVDSLMRIEGGLKKGSGKTPLYLSFPKIEVVRQKKSLRFYLSQLRDTASYQLLKILPTKEANFLSGILYGENNDRNLASAMILSGTSHLTAISGYNVTIISANLYRLFQIIGFSRIFVFFGALISIFLFTIFVGAQASVVRAALLGSILLFSGVIGRIPYLRNVLLVVALLMLAVNPLLLVFDISFQLSFLAFLGILYVGPFIQQWLLRLLKIREFGKFSFVLKPLSETLAAQLMVLPLISFSFGRTAPFSPFSNLLILPLIPLTMAIGFGFLALSALLLPLALFLSPALKILIDYHVFIIESFARIPFSNIALKVPFPLLLIFYSMIFMLLYRYHKKKIGFNFFDTL